MAGYEEVPTMSGGQEVCLLNVGQLNTEAWPQGGIVPIRFKAKDLHPKCSPFQGNALTCSPVFSLRSLPGGDPVSPQTMDGPLQRPLTFRCADGGFVAALFVVQLLRF